MAGIARFAGDTGILWITWGWRVLLEGPHFWATYGRTYLDAGFRRERPELLVGSLVFFLLPLAAWYSPYRELFSSIVLSWGLLHILRQHYGFVLLYARKSALPEAHLEKLRWAVYAMALGPLLHYVVNAYLPATFGTAGRLPSAPFLGMAALGGLWALGISRSGPVRLYLVVLFLFWNGLFFDFGGGQPFLLNLGNLERTLLVVTIADSIFHCVQYLGLVWHYGRRRYGGAGEYGLARRIHSRVAVYAAVALLFSVGYGVVLWGRGLTLPGGPASDGSMARLAYVLYLGLLGHHFYLDQKIWRVSRAPELRRTLFPAPT